MKNKKLTLNNIAISSFVTSLDDENKKTIIAGDGIIDGPDSKNSCYQTGKNCPTSCPQGGACTHPSQIATQCGSNCVQNTRIVLSGVYCSQGPACTYAYCNNGEN